VGTYIFVGTKGLDGNIWLNQGSGLGTTPFVGWQPIGFHSDVAPAAVGAGDNIFFFAKHPDGRIFFNRAKLGQAFQGWAEVSGGGQTDAAPTAGAVGTYIFVGIKGLDDNLYLNQGSGLGTTPFLEWQPMT
jgi:hypothetical protein